MQFIAGLLIGMLLIGLVVSDIDAQYMKPIREAKELCEKELPRHKKCDWRVEAFAKEDK